LAIYAKRKYQLGNNNKKEEEVLLEKKYGKVDIDKNMPNFSQDY